MPQIGESMEKGMILKWLRATGELLEEGAPLVEIETEKATLEIETPQRGYLHIAVEEGAEVLVGELMAYLLEEGEGPPIVPPDSVMTDAVPARSAIRVTPVARRIAKEFGVDLNQVKGTGPSGRIVERDVRNFLEIRTSPDRSAEADTNAAAGVQENIERTTAAMVPGLVLEYQGMRKAIGERMRRSLLEMAQLTIGTKVDITAVDEMRQHFTGSEVDTPKPTFTDFVIKATAIALKEHPLLNGVFQNESIRLSADVNIGIAIAVEKGLIVPVLHSSDRKSLLQIARENRRLAQAARAGSFGQKDLMGGTFTITTLGSLGVDMFTPIVNVPEIAILGVGAVEEVLKFDHEKIVAKKEMRLNLSFDHRVLDGYPAALFLSRIRELLERPVLLLAE
jgi:pyruvate dehydrogenase E2 component (dihydrolipoamide acetyltransferase)